MKKFYIENNICKKTVSDHIRKFPVRGRFFFQSKPGANLATFNLAIEQISKIEGKLIKTKLISLKNTCGISQIQCNC